MKKLLVVIFSLLFVFVLVSCVDSNNKSNNAADVISKAKANRTDMTQNFNKLDISKANKIIEVNSELSFKTRCQTFEEIYDNSQYIIKGTVNRSYFTVFEGMPFNVVDICVDDSVKGKIKNNSIITVLFYGGYITVEQEVLYYNDEDKFSDVERGQRKNTYIKEKLTNSDFASKGDEYVLCLMDNKLKDETYVAVNEFETIFKRTKNDEYKRLLPSEDYFGEVKDTEKYILDRNYQKESERKTYLKDNISFSYKDFKNACLNF